MVEFIIWKINSKTKVPYNYLEGDKSEDVILESFKDVLKEDKENIWALRIRGK